MFERVRLIDLSVPLEDGAVSQQQDSRDVLQDWFRAAAQAFTFEQFLVVLRQ